MHMTFHQLAADLKVFFILFGKLCKLEIINISRKTVCKIRDSKCQYSTPVKFNVSKNSKIPNYWPSRKLDLDKGIHSFTNLIKQSSTHNSTHNPTHPATLHLLHTPSYFCKPNLHCKYHTLRRNKFPRLAININKSIPHWNTSQI